MLSDLELQPACASTDADDVALGRLHSRGGHRCFRSGLQRRRQGAHSSVANRRTTSGRRDLAARTGRTRRRSAKSRTSRFEPGRRRFEAFNSLAAMGRRTGVSSSARGEAATTFRLPVYRRRFFRCSALRPQLGRTLRPEDDRQGSGRVAVMSHGAWVRRFGSDPGIVGRSLRFESGAVHDRGDHARRVSIIRVAQSCGCRSCQSWPIPASNGRSTPSTIPRGVCCSCSAVSGPGVSIEAARHEVSSLIARDAGTGFRPGMEAAMTPLDEHIFGNTRPAFCRACDLRRVGAPHRLRERCGVAAGAHRLCRADETATRLAIGATRWRIVRQSLSDAARADRPREAGGAGLRVRARSKLLVALAPATCPVSTPYVFDVRDVRVHGACCALRRPSSSVSGPGSASLMARA